MARAKVTYRAAKFTCHRAFKSSLSVEHGRLFYGVLVSKRLFLGLVLPASCKATLHALDPQLNGLRWLPANQLHLTLSFLGEVDAYHQEVLCEALRTVVVPPFFLPLQGAGVFEVRSRPSVLWVGVGHGHPHLFALHRRIQDAVLRARIEPDLRPFHPHVTLGRAKGVSRQALQPFLRKHRDTEFDLFKVNDFALYSSVCGHESATHFLEMRQTLARPLPC